MKIKSIRSVRFLRGVRVLVRVDLNISLKSGTFQQSDIWKLQSILPTLQLLRRKGACIILLSSRGRPKGFEHDATLEPIVIKLSSMVGSRVSLWKNHLDECAKMSEKLAPGEIVCLENLRFYNEEYTNSAAFAKKLSRCGDIYVNDAFANIHRTHASMVAITRYLPTYAGLLLEYELSNLYDLLHRAKHPIVAIIGGNKISTKILLIKKLLHKVDSLLMGGALANNVLAAMNYKVGRSVVEEDMFSWSKGILSNKLKVPLDAVVASSPQAKKTRISAIGAVHKHEMILDLGPETVEFYAQYLKVAKTIIWNGPLGFFEEPRFAKATSAMVREIANTRAQSYVGGGETVKAVLAQHLEKKIHFISTGGGAMLSLLEGRPLPALRAVMKR